MTITTALSAPQSCKKTRANQILKINATCMSWIQLHKCISTISYLARWHLVGISLVSNAIPVVHSWSPTEGRLILWSHWPRLKSFEPCVISHCLYSNQRVSLQASNCCVRGDSGQSMSNPRLSYFLLHSLLL